MTIFNGRYIFFFMLGNFQPVMFLGCFWVIRILFFREMGIWKRSDRKKTVAGNKPVGKPLHCHEDFFLHALGPWGYALPSLKRIQRGRKFTTETHPGWSRWNFQKNRSRPIWMFPKTVGFPKSSILIGFSIRNHPFWCTTVFGNTHFKRYVSFREIIFFRTWSLTEITFITWCAIHWTYPSSWLRQTNTAMKHLFHFSWYENGGFSMAMLLVV